ncbi:MAG: UvrD-helicase domain-containing protein, partial [Muribaculaceae bacterium]|nr:UvrD-helicase domain-containing protein [Muribaculaceae bacterium]
MDNLHVLKASAGSGKTFTLARQYIENLLWKPATGNSKAQFRNESEYHSHILAITFTTKATDEMKSRIIKELYKLTLKKGQHIDYFVTKYGNTKEEIAQEAKKALREILFNYSTFHVSTIDSFFQQVLRTFAHELDQEYNYDLELDEEFALKNAIHNFFLTLGTKKQNKDIDKWVTDYLKEDTKKDGTWNIFSEYNEEKIKKFTKVINTERFRKHREEIIAYLADPKKINEFKKKLVEARNKRISDWEQRKDHSPQEFRDLVTKLGGDVTKFKSNTPWLKFLQEKYEYDEKKEFYTSTFRNHTLSDLRKLKSLENHNDNTLQQLLDYRDRVINEYKRIEMLKEATKDIWKLGLLGQIENKLEEYRKDNNTVLIADTNDLISKVIESGVPFMYERLGTWLNTFMLDEFQ